MSPPRRDHRKTAAARPVNQVTDKCGLVPECKGIHHTGLRRLTGKQWPAEGVCLYRYVNYMLAVGERLQAVIDSGNWVARAFHDDIDTLIANQCLPVISDPGCALRQCVLNIRRLGAFGSPTYALQINTRICRRKIGDNGQMYTRGAWHLGQIHGAELSG